MTELIHLSCVAQARLIRSRQLSPVELLKKYLDRIEKFDPILRAWITIQPERALTAAKQSEDEIARGAYRGLLHGLPYGVKDQIHADGFPTTMGSRVLNKDETAAPYNATVIERLGKAGAILLGKQNLHEFGKGGTIAFPFGQPRNPWNPAYSASSSSTGSGIAPAAGMCSFSLGEDTGGSIRGPASYNGVVGVRPTYGRVSRFGCVAAAYTSDTIGPLGRTVEDVALVLEAISGFDSHDPLCSNRPVPEFRANLRKGIKGSRLAIVREIACDGSTHSEVQESFRRAVDVLSHCGAKISEVSLPHIRYAVPLQMLSADVDVASQYLKKYLQNRYHRFDIGTRTRMAASCLVPATVYNRAMRGRTIVRSQVLKALKQYDGLICPTSVTPPKNIDAMQEKVSNVQSDVVTRLVERRLALYPFSLSNVPAISVPSGFSKQGLPLALQIAAAPFREEMMFRIAYAFEQATEWHRKHPELEQTLATAT